MVVLPGIIVLGGSPRRGRIERGLNVLSSLLLEPKTLLTKGISAAESKVARRRERVRRGDRTEAFNIIGETLTATALGAGALLGGATVPGRLAVRRFAPKLIPKTVKGKIFAVTGVGALVTSPTARRFVSETIQDPTRAGREVGRLIEKGVAGEALPGFLDVLKTAGIVGVGVAGIAGAVGLVKKLKDREVPGGATPSDVPPSIALPTAAIPGVFAPMAEGPVVAEAPQTDLPPTEVPDINVKVINKPQINVAVAQSL